MLMLREVGRGNTKFYVSQSARHGPRIVTWEFCYVIPRKGALRDGICHFIVTSYNVVHGSA